MPTMNWYDKILEHYCETCPTCGEPMHLWSKPINVQFYRCTVCEDEFWPEWIEGYKAGLTRAAQLQLETESGGVQVDAQDIERTTENATGK